MADAPRAPKFDILAAFSLPCCGPSTAAFLRLQTATSVRSDDQPLREEPVLHEPVLTPWRSPEPLAAKERLDHPVQRPLVDVAAEALVQAVTEVEILVVLTTWVEAVRLRNPPVIHHGRSEGREDRGALRDRPRPLRGARQRPVGLRDAWQARPDRIEAHRLPHDAPEPLVFIRSCGRRRHRKGLGSPEQLLKRLWHHHGRLRWTAHNHAEQHRGDLDVAVARRAFGLPPQAARHHVVVGRGTARLSPRDVSVEMGTEGWPISSTSARRSLSRRAHVQYVDPAPLWLGHAVAGSQA
jgi:hypothetical protein